MLNSEIPQGNDKKSFPRGSLLHECVLFGIEIDTTEIRPACESFGEVWMIRKRLDIEDATDSGQRAAQVTTGMMRALIDAVTR